MAVRTAMFSPPVTTWTMLSPSEVYEALPEAPARRRRVRSLTVTLLLLLLLERKGEEEELAALVVVLVVVVVEECPRLRPPAIRSRIDLRTRLALVSVGGFVALPGPEAAGGPPPLAQPPGWGLDVLRRRGPLAAHWTPPASVATRKIREER